MAPLDWNGSCRLCSEKKTEMFEIFGEEGIRRRVAQKLRVCLPVMVYKSDPLPKKICQFCAARLDDAYEFREYCLSVYKNMHFKLLASKNLTAVKMFLDAMSASPDPCQVRLCMIKQRAPPPLVPLPAKFIPVKEKEVEPMVELPCEVQIKEEPVEADLDKLDFESGVGDSDHSLADASTVGENGCLDEKQTSILERVLKGDLTVNDCKDVSPKSNSQLCCSMCNSYCKTKESLIKHMEFECPKKHECGKCLIIFRTFDELTRHEESCHRHKNEIKAEPFQKIHDLMQNHLNFDAVKREPIDGIKSLVCPTCGKICTQQSALSNHMRTHEPKKHKCDICGRTFGLFIRLAAHKLSEHNQQPPMKPEISTIEQEEALNDEREAREREVRAKDRCRTFSETLDKDELDEERPAKRTSLSTNVNKNVARCGICQQWFNDHTTMLNHLQTHSDNLNIKNFNCSSCKKTFREKWQLQRHEVLSHKRAKVVTYDCSVCNKPFPEKSQLENHEKIHVVDRTYRCAKCDKIFFKELSLITHQCARVPQFGKKNSPSKLPATKESSSTAPTISPGNQIKKFKCPKCSATFDTSQLRNLHIRIHIEPKVQNTDDVKSMPKLKPQSSFSEPDDKPEEQNYTVPLKRTLIRTSGGYRCGVCQSPFVLRDLAVAHLRSAHPMMPYQCPYCKQRFTTQYEFSHHIKTSHPNESE
ncbi:Similar to ZNF808: Zinc finger protein 808 (Homo sapiens) [Cotesia congregata]|uniref:Similar to ZNF808: Zinc finger protein 808 (Homo sapiens) n=1 Tax=Cotesia congregata TaxID=51543 RepID=A0A8J2HS49_COTCN|nr:Similar to ZNF808: Zinc finger protein 808 (Homo sapiens) [Cotesia congregata]